MLHGKRVVVLLPAFKAERTLEKTVAAIPGDVVVMLHPDYRYTPGDARPAADRTP